MSKKKSIWMCSLIFVLTFVCAVGCYAKEHPKEHPTENDKEAAITKVSLADAIEAYVQEQSNDEGYFVIADDQTGDQLELTLDKVHRSKLGKVGMNTYFACADFKATNGNMYDLDVFMIGESKDDLAFSSFLVHKVNGKERYTWYEEDGLWRTKAIEE